MPCKVRAASWLKPRVPVLRPAHPPACPTAHSSRALDTYHFQWPRPDKSDESALKMRHPCDCGSAIVATAAPLAAVGGDGAA